MSSFWEVASSSSVSEGEVSVLSENRVILELAKNVAPASSGGGTERHCLDNGKVLSK